MKRSRLKNIINKSKSIFNKQEVGNPFDEFKKSLPIEVDNNYRLESAWKAYGSPKNYQEALWQGLIQPIDENNVKLPSIGYNEETDEYEYLNKGRENETVAKDIRVWDNDVIPLVKELKQGGFIRVYDEEKDCWKYSKNKPQETQNESWEVIEEFKSGGKKKIRIRTHEDTYIELESLTEDQKKGRTPVGKNSKGQDLYLGGDGIAAPLNYTPGKMENGGIIDSFQKGGKSEQKTYSRNIEQLITYANNQKPPFIQRILKNDERTYTFPDGKIGTHLLNYDTYNGKTYVFPEIQEDPAGNLWWYKDRALDRALERNNVLEMTPEEAELFVKEYKKYYPNYKPFKMEDGGELSYFKQGGQMNVIPEGALHARKNNMELAKEGEITHKGVPVVDNDGNQQAEVEKEEWTMTKELTEDVEKWYKKYYDEETSQKDKDELAIKCGKRITEELLHNTDDRANLITKMLEEEE